MTGMQIVLGALILVAIAAGAFIVGKAIGNASGREKPKLFSIGLLVLIAGAALGYIAVNIFLQLEAGGH